MDIESQATKVVEQLEKVYGRKLDREIIHSVAFNCQYHLGRSSSALDEITANATSSPNSRSTNTNHFPNHISQTTAHELSPQHTAAAEWIKQGYKVLVILRGLPGSGKSYLARKIVEITVGTQDYHKFIFSADDFFMRRGTYQYDPTKLQDAHGFNQSRAFDAMRRGISPVIIDNTNTQMWEMKPYAMVASQNAYIIEILEPDTRWAFNERELSRRNTHGVPRVKLKEMLMRYDKNITRGRLFSAFNIRYTAESPPQLRSYPPLTVNVKCTSGEENGNARVAATKEYVRRPLSVDEMLSYSGNSNEPMLTPVLSNGYCTPTQSKAKTFTTPDLSTWGVSEEALYSWDICTPVVAETIKETEIPAQAVAVPSSTGIEMAEATTNTCASDFLLAANPCDANETEMKVFTTSSREINPQQPGYVPPLTKKTMMDQGSMVGEDLMEQRIEEKDALQRLSAIFPAIPHIYLREVYDRCTGDLNWATDLLCDDNLHKLVTPQDVFPEELEEERKEAPQNEDVSQNDGAKQGPNSTPEVVSQNCETKQEEFVDRATEWESLKRLLEEKVVIRDEFYSEHTLKLKSKTVAHDSTPQPSTSDVQTICTEAGTVLAMDSDVDMDEFDLETTTTASTSSTDEPQEMMELNLGEALVTELESKLQELSLIYPKGFLPIVQIPIALARQLYALYIESVYQQMDAQKEVLDMLIKEDEELARKLQAQEQQVESPKEPLTLPEIMDEQHTLNLHRKQSEQWKNLTPDDLAAQLTKKKLFESFPNIGKDVLLEIWQAHGNNYRETVESILASSPEQAAKDEGEIKKLPVPEEVVEEMRELHSQQGPPANDNENKTANCYRQDAARYLENRKLLYQKAMQAYQRGMTEVAIYYSDLAKKQTELYDQANNLAASTFLNEHSERHQNYDTLDLHFLYVKEAIAALDIFLDNSVHLLKGTNRTQYLFIITGRGKRSANGISKIKPAVKTRLKKRKVNYVEVNPGLLKVKVNEHSIITTDLSETRNVQNS